jgi:hypothetical protein
VTNKEAWLYAAAWGSYIREGDPGACLYGFSERFQVQSEAHREACLREMKKNRAFVVICPEDYDRDELEKIDALVAKLRAAPLVLPSERRSSR